MYVFKPLVVITIAVNYMVSTSKINRLFMLVYIFQIIGDTIFVKEDQESFMLGIGFFFIINVLLSLLVVYKIDVLNPKDVLKIFVPVSITILTIVYIIFASIGFVKVLILTFTLTVAILLSVATKYFLSSKKQAARWVLIGAISMTLCYIFSGTIRLVKAHFIFSVLESSFYCFSLYCYSRFVLLEDNQVEETILTEKS